MAIRRIQERATENLFTNTEISGTEAAKMPVGTTAQRANVKQGDIRFNSTISLMEYYDGTQWKSIDSPPIISSISPNNFDTAGDTITITGSNFQSGATVKIIASDAQELAASSVTFTNSSTVTFVITSAMVADNGDPYDVELTNPSGLVATVADALDFAPEPAWTKAAGSLGTLYDVNKGSASITTGATSTESDATITYAVTTGSLPTGLSISSSTGTITGSYSSLGSDTTTTFSLTATATDSGGSTTTNVRAYSILQKAPVITSYTSTGSGTFNVPTGVATVTALVVAGGGSGAYGDSSWWGAGGGGAGGLIYRPAYPVTPGGSVSYTVGTGGAAATSRTPGQNSNGAGKEGQNSVFGVLTALGGGGGAGDGCWPANADPSNQGSGSGGQGGSGGGGSGPSPATYGVGPRLGGQGQQPAQPQDSGTYGFGFDGGGGSSGPGGGGGGAGANGAHGGPTGGEGGVGKQYAISGSQVYYGGGGGGCNYPGHTGPNSQNQGSGGNGGGGNGRVQPGGGFNGTANRGGGAGGGGQSTGGSGVVIITY